MFSLTNASSAWLYFEQNIPVDLYISFLATVTVAHLVADDDAIKIIEVGMLDLH